MFVIQALVGVFLTKKKKRWRGFLVPRFSKFPPVVLGGQRSDFV